MVSPELLIIEQPDDQNLDGKIADALNKKLPVHDYWNFNQ
jgi:hypothetical protein